MGDTSNQVLLSAFADEGSRDKTIDQQFSTMAALGLEFYSIRFVDAGQGVKNVLDLTDAEIETVLNGMREFGLAVSSIGSPIGKVKIADIDDRSSNRFIPFEKYLADDVHRACRAANDFDCKLVRGFSFYHPQHQKAGDYFDQAVEQLGQIADCCDKHGVTFGLEVETNLIGNSGQMLARIHSAVDHPALVLVFDGGNLVTQGFTTDEILTEFRAMLGGLGWIHVKDSRPLAGSQSNQDRQRIIDEDAISSYVPAEQGATNYRMIFQELLENFDIIQRRTVDRGIPGFFVDLEPHLRGGGQFGGFSGPDGMGIALRSLCRILDDVSIGYRLRDFETLQSTT